MGRVNLSRMHIKNARTPFPDYFPSHTSDQEIWKQSQVAAAEKTDRPPENSRNRDRKLDQPIRIIADPVRCIPARRHPAVSSRSRKNRGIVTVAGFHQLLEKPRSFLGYGESRRT